MSGETARMQHIGQAEKAVHRRPSYLGQALGMISLFLGLASSQSHDESQPDGLEAFDMLGGWEGTDARRRNIR